MAEGKPGKRTKFALLVAILVLALGLSASLLTTPADQLSPESMQSRVPAPESAFGSSLEYEEKSEVDLPVTEDDGCTPPATVPDIDLLPGEYLEYVEYEECKWDLVLWNSEGDGTIVSPESQCRPMPQDPEDGSGFYVELVPCDFTLVRVDQAGDLVLVDPSPESKKVWDSWTITEENDRNLVSEAPSSQAGKENVANDLPAELAQPADEQESNESGDVQNSEDDDPFASLTNFCHWERSYDPERYDQCREGFEPPTHVVFTGITKCVKSYEPDPPVTGGMRPRPPGEYPVYTITYGIKLVGGNVREVFWEGVSQRDGSRQAFMTRKYYGLPEGPFGSYKYPIDPYPNFMIRFGPMLAGFTGDIYSDYFDSVPPGQTSDSTFYSDLTACN